MRRIAMRKSLATGLVMALAVFFAACTPKETPATTVSGEKVYRVAFMLNTNLGDKSWADSCGRGMETVARTYSNVETKFVEAGDDRMSWEPALIDLSEQNWDLIFTSTGDMQEILERVAAQYPNQKYVFFDAVVDAPNVYSIEFKQNEASFLAGALGAMITGSGINGTNPAKIIGAVGGMDIPIINDFMVGYISGAQYIDPEVKVVISYAGSFSDPTRGKELALIQINMGSDVVYQVAGGTGLGVLQGAAENGILSIGVDSDQAATLADGDPRTASRIMTSVLKNADVMVVQCVEKFLSNSLTFGKADRLGVAEGAMGIVKNANFDSLVPREIRDRILSLESEVRNGSISILSALSIDRNEVTRIINSARP